MSTRQETDSLGKIAVPQTVYWGAQTQRSLKNFAIGHEKMPPRFIHAMALVKKACAISNKKLAKLDSELAQTICQVCDEITSGNLAEHFPLAIWQTGSGTQTNMNLNEVIANRGAEILGKPLGQKIPIHPNDHVNLSQSSNDVIPTAMHVAAVLSVKQQLLPALESLLAEFKTKEQAFSKATKVGRTHFMDATPITVGQEFSAFVSHIEQALEQIKQSLPNVLQLALGATAVGTGLNSHRDWKQTVCQEIAQLTGENFVPAKNSFSALANHDGLLQLSAALRQLATALFKIANDIRMLGSGPRCGLGELQLPANEPGSSIMPGKVNPTQAEALTMLCLQVQGNDNTIAMAQNAGQLQLNVFKPLVMFNILQSIQLLADGSNSFNKHCLQGITLNQKQLDKNLEQSLMLVTALTPVIGYDNAAKTAKYAFENNCTLKQAVLTLGYLTEAQFDENMDPRVMLGPQK